MDVRILARYTRRVCDDSVIRDMFAALPEGSREELWDGAETLEVECPRCGRGYEIRRGRSE